MSKKRRVEEKIDHIVSEISQINVTLAKQSVILDEHVKRSNMLEDKLEPIERHVSMVRGALKFIGLIGTILGVILAILKLLK